VNEDLAEQLRQIRNALREGKRDENERLNEMPAEDTPERNRKKE